MKKIFLFTLFSLSINFSNAQKLGQELIDSLLTELPKAKEDTGKVELLNNLGYASKDMNRADSMLKYCEVSLALAEKLNFKKGKGDALNIIGIAYEMKSDNVQAL